MLPSPSEPEGSERSPNAVTTQPEAHPKHPESMDSQGSAILFQEVWDEFQESGYLPCLGSADSLHSLSVKDDETKTEQN